VAGQPSAIIAAIRIMERRSRLFGLDAPTKVEVSDGTTLEERIAQARSRGAALKRERDQAAGSSRETQQPSDRPRARFEPE
jgi:hypothetical protein